MKLNTNTNHGWRQLAPTLFACGILLWLGAGCATPDKNALPKYSFYPVAPDEPHVQYLTSFQSSKDFAKSGSGAFTKFLTGQADPLMFISKPYGGAAGKGKIYVCDTASGAVMRLRLNEQKMDAIVGAGSVSFSSPVNLAVDEDGSLYVVDLGLNQLIVMDKDENLVGTVGEKGAMKPMDVAVTKDRIYLSDVASHTVHVLDKATRKPLFEIPNAAEAASLATKLFQPINITLDKEGRLYVSDFGASRVQVYGPDGKFIRTVGGRGDNYGEFTRPKGIAVDRDNRLYVVDAAGQMVQMFDETGRLLMWFGESSKRQVSLFLPAKVLVDYDDVGLFQKYAAPNFQVEHLLVVMNQYGSKKVAVFGFGHKK